MNNYLSYRRILSIFALVLFSVFVVPSYASALTISPTRFEIKGNPGDVLDGEIILINETENTETYYPSYSNFEAQGESGSPAFVEPKDGLGTWMNIKEESITIFPRQQKIVPFTVNVPKDAEPGGNFAVIFFGSSPSGSSGVSIGSKTGILILLSVNGDVREDAGLLNFNTVGKKFFYQTLPVSMEYRFKNDGGDRIKPKGKIIIRNTIFLPTEKLDANPVEGNVLPGSTRKITVDWVKYERPDDFIPSTQFFNKFWNNVEYQWKNFAVGLYSANLNVTYGAEAEHVKKTVFFFVFPWQLVIVMILVLIIAFWGGKKLIKRYNRHIIAKARAGM